MFFLDKRKSFCQFGIYRKAKKTWNKPCLFKISITMNIETENRATCKLFLQKKIESGENERKY